MARAAATRKKLPTDAYDFTNGVLTPWRGTQSITYTRTGSQYSLDTDGYYTANASNSPALTKIDTPSWTFQKGLLLSEQRTNIAHNSEAMGTGQDDSVGVSVTDDSAVFIDGNTTMDTLTDSGAAGHYIGQVVSATTPWTGLCGIFLKKGTMEYGRLKAGGSGNSINFNIDLQAMTAYSTPTINGGTGSTSFYGIEHVGNNVYFAWVSGTGVGGSNTFNLDFYVADTYAHLANSWAAVSHNVYAGGLQCYTGALYPGTYIANTGNSPSTSTVYAPSCSSSLPEYVTNGDAFSLYIEVQKHFAATTNKNGTPALFELKQNNSNYYTVLLNQTTANVQQNLVLAGASDFGTDASFSWNRNQKCRYMVTFDGTSTWKLYANGSLLRTDTATGAFAPTTLELAKTVSTMYGIFTYRKVAIWNFAHSATDAAAYTNYGW